MNHKRYKPRKQRGHCHMCKYHKDIGNSKEALSVSGKREREAFKDLLAEEGEKGLL